MSETACAKLKLCECIEVQGADFFGAYLDETESMKEHAVISIRPDLLSLTEEIIDLQKRRQKLMMSALE